MAKIVFQKRKQERNRDFIPYIAIVAVFLAVTAVLTVMLAI